MNANNRATEFRIDGTSVGPGGHCLGRPNLKWDGLTAGLILGSDNRARLPITVDFSDTSSPKHKQKGSAGRILVVDDDTDFAHGMGDMLLGGGYDVRVATSYEEACEIVVGFEAQVAILDYQLGRATGIDLAAWLKKRRPNLICLLATAHADLETAIRSFRRGFYDFFRKPVQTNELLLTLQRCFERLQLEADMAETQKALQEREKALSEQVERLEESQRKLERQGEDLVRARQDAEDANAAKSEFLATFSHELRTPLNAVIGFSEIIKSEMLGTINNKKYLEYAEDIHNSGQHLRDLICDILDLSQIEAGKMELNESIFSLTEIAASVLCLSRHRAVEGGVDLKRDLPDDLPAIRGDERRFKQALLNIVTNAIKFTGNGGSVTVAANLFSNGDLAVRIVDTGVGIAPDDIPQALSSYGMVGRDSRIAEAQEGTGLGLPITKALMELHGGSIRLESDVNVGTIVSLTLPAARLI